MGTEFAALYDAEGALDIPPDRGWASIDDHFAVLLPAESRPSWRAETWQSPEKATLACFWGEFYNPQDFDLSPEVSAAQRLTGLLERGQVEQFGRLNGAFLFMHYERATRRLTVVNDHLAFLPTYFACRATTVGFANSLLTLRRLGFDLGGPDLAGLSEMFTFRHALGTRTLFDRASLVPPGSICLWRGNAITSRRYFHWPARPQTSPNMHEVFENMRQQTNRAVALRSTSRMGLFVSGGIDTRATISALTVNGTQFRGFTTGRRGCLDRVLATRIARALNIPHTVLMPGQDFLREFPVWAAEIAALSGGEVDALNAHGPLNQRQIASQVSTVLCAVGGEVLRLWYGFRGQQVAGGGRAAFTRFALRTFPRRADASALFSGEARAAMAGALETSLESSLSQIEEFGGSSDWEQAFFLHERMRRIWGAGAFVTRQYLDVRYPFFDIGFLRSAWTAPLTCLLSREALTYIIRQNDPRLLRWFTTKGGFGPKDGGSRWQAAVGWATLTANRGFHVLSRRWPRRFPATLDRRVHLPYVRWFARELHPHLREILLDRQTSRRGILDIRGVESALEQHRAMRRDLTGELAFCLTVELAYRGLLS